MSEELKVMTQLTEYKRDLLRKMLSECSEGQVAIFNRMYGSVDAIEEPRMDWALQQCETTILKNRERSEK